MPPHSPSIFLSYSHKDEAWKNRLSTHLGSLDLDLWDDRRIAAGAMWRAEIQQAMDRASVAVLLISADYLASKFVREEEIPKLLARRQEEDLAVIPVLVRPCAWQEIGWLREISICPPDGQSLAGLRGHRRDAEMANIAREILRLLHAEDGNWRRGLDRRDDFLSRVETVCRHHEAGAQIDRFPVRGAAGSYLRVTRLKGIIRDVFPVGAVEHSLSRESYQSFLDEIDAPYRKTDPGMISSLVYGGPPAPENLVKEAASRRIHLVSFVEYQGLIDFRPYLLKQTQKLAGDPIYPPSLYVHQRMRTLSILGQEEGEAADALAQVREWLAATIGRFIVLLGDFGTGKTFLLHELARRMGESEGGLVPILLQMRSLEKGRSLDELLAQHFAREGMESFSPAKFRYMLEQGRIALLFDGFDELALRVTYAKAADHFATLLQAATGSAKVVLTSRRQHFLSESQVKTALAEEVERLSGHRLAILQPFEREQIHSFLVNFFAGDETKAEARLNLIDRVKDLLGLSENPRLLGFIAELTEDQLTAASAAGGEITAAKLYELLLDRWLILEFDRAHPKGAPPGLSKEERWQAVSLLALRLWQKTDRFVSLSELSEETARVVQAVGPATPDSDVNTFQVGSGTLLVRDEEGNFAFLHQSVLEWLVARSAAEAISGGTHPDALASREMSPLMADFFADLAGKDRVIAWARSVLSSPAGEAANKNALLVLERQKEEIRETLDLSGQDLRGRDFSGQDLSRANLSGADLTDAQLVRTTLSEVRLVRATLRDVDLTRAILHLADLREVDLTGARLLGADLRGARFMGAHLRRAKLLGTIVEPKLGFDSADTFGAALSFSELNPNSSLTLEECSAVAWNPDGELLAIASGSVVQLWETRSGREIRALAGHQNRVWSVAFSPDGKSLASGSFDQTVRLWKVDSGREVRVLTGHENRVSSVAFSPDGKSLASGSDDHTVRLWQVDSGREIRALTGHQNWVLSVAFSPDGKSLASGSYDHTVRLWQVDSGREVRVLNGHHPVLSVAFSPDGESLASGSDDHTVRLWQVDSGREIGALTGHQSWVWSVAFSPDGKSLASGSYDKTVRLWQIDSGREITALTGHQSWVWSVAFSPDGKSLASGSDDKTVRLWQVDSKREIRVLTGYQNPALSVAFSPDGKSLASGSGNRTIHLWQVDSGRKISALTEHQSWVWSVVFSPDSKSLASSDDTTVRLWQVDSGEIRALTGHQNTVRSVAFSPDGKSLASGSDDKTVHLWKIDSGRKVRVLTGHQKTVLSVAFSPDGTSLASGSDDKTVRLWQVDSGREIRALTGHQDTVRSVAFSPDGKSLASGSDDKTIRLWQVESGRKMRALTGHQNTVLSVAFSPDGKSLASGSEDTTIRLWQVYNRGKSRNFTGHLGSVLSVAFSPSGKSLASGSSDGTIRLWSVADGRCLAVLLSLPEGWVAYSPDGRYKFGGVPAGGFWHVVSLCRFEIGELDEWVPGLRLADDASFFDLPPWKPEVRVPE
jgi:WD40 repeat protein